MIMCTQEAIVRPVDLCYGKKTPTCGALNLLLPVLRYVQVVMARLHGINPLLNPITRIEAPLDPYAASFRSTTYYILSFVNL